MTARERFERLVRAAAGRPGTTLAVVLALALAGGVLALGLEPSAGSDTFVSRSSPSGVATSDDHRHFGGDAVIVLIREPLPDLVQTRDLASVSQLEACLGGQVLVADERLGAFTTAAPGAAPYGGWGSACGKLMKARPVQVVYGPGTFLNRAVAAVNTKVQAMIASANGAVAAAGRSAYQLALARGLSRKQALTVAGAARQLERQQQYDMLAQTYLNSGISGTPRIDDPQFIPEIVFDQTRGVNQPKARFAYLFPTADSALIQVRLKSSLTDSQQATAISWIEQAVKIPMFRSAYGGTYTVTGAPVVANALASEITSSVGELLIAALLVMAATLLIVFRSRLRLLPLAIALAAVGITFGAMALVGASLTMASLAVLPILIGLAADYAIQFQSRAREARRAQADGEIAPELAVARAAATGAPTIATAALATATGFLVLLLSPVPMVRGFGVLLIVGIAVALACALTAGPAAMVLGDRDGGILAASLRGARDLLRDAGRRAGPALTRALGRVGRVAQPARARATAVLWRLPGRALAAPRAIIAVGAVLAVLGWVADTQTPVQSDVTKLVPASMPALRDLRTLERITGVSGEIDVVIRAADVATPRTIAWMIRYEDALFQHYGYLETQGCARSILCPALSLPDLFSAGHAGRSAAAGLTPGSIEGLLEAVPGYFSRAVITPDHREATLAFGIRLMPLARQQGVIDYMRSQLHPPSGVSAALAGLPVLAAQANAALSSSGRRLLTLLAGLIAVGVALLAVLRRVERVLVALIPIALATGWSALTVFLIGIPLNPMSATLGALVIAISTEFSVLMSERYHRERERGLEPAAALARTYRLTGAPVLASGITAIAGFGVLILSSITMLRDFGFVTLIDLSVSLGGVLLVLPSVLAVTERGDHGARIRQLVSRSADLLPRPRRRAPVA